VGCAPKIEQELGAMQAAQRMHEVQMKVSNTSFAQDVNVERVQVALCPHCGQEAQGSSKFCPECGKPLATSLTCEKCGTEVPAGTKFCPECGDPI
jgi:membrane protease subunit (stomatin/prohibitin family)